MNPLVAARMRFLLIAALSAAPVLRAQQAQPVAPPPPAQVVPAPSAPQAETVPIAIVLLDSNSADSAASVTGALEISQGKAIIATSGTVTAGSATTPVTLPHRGVLRICASTTVKLAVDSSVPAGEVPGLMMAMDHGAIETSFAISHDSDVLLTPDFRILIAGPGAAAMKIRLGQNGDTCVDNPGVNAPYVLVSSVFDGGAYRVQPGQRVMFQHGSLKEVVDQEKEPCGCPPAAPTGNEFPLAQSEGLAPLPASPAAAPAKVAAKPQPVPPLVYNAAEHAPTPVAEPTPPPAAPAPEPKKKSGFFTSIGHFFKRIFGAD